jgi:hypothetical protein
VYHLFFAPGYGVREAELDDWSGALRLALDRTFEQLQENPTIGETYDPFSGDFVLGVSLFAGRLDVDLYYHVDVQQQTVEVLDVRFAPPQR